MLRNSRLIYNVYSVARSLARRTRIHGTIRRLLGPVAGRIVYRALSKGNEPLTIQGNLMYLSPEGRYPSPDMVADRYEPATTCLFRTILQPGMTVIDVGANIGYFTLVAARQVGITGKVIAVEPEPRNNTILQQNVNLNKYTNVCVVEKAVSSYTGYTQLFLSALDNGSHSISDKAARGVVDIIDVPTTTLDDLIEQFGSPSIDLVKIDVEGAEMAVLEGMTTLLRNDRCLRLIIEFCPYLMHASDVDPVEFLKRISELGFSINVIDDEKGLLPLSANLLETLTIQLLSSESYKNIYCLKA